MFLLQTQIHTNEGSYSDLTKLLLIATKDVKYKNNVFVLESKAFGRNSLNVVNAAKMHNAFFGHA